MRRTLAEMVESVENVLSDLGDNAGYAAVTQELTARGHNDAVQNLRSMKYSGIVTMSLERNEEGQIVHLVRMNEGVAE